MKYTCVDTVEFLYPDITDYKSGTDRICILTPRGSYACAQIFLWEGKGNVQVSCEGWNPEIYEMMAIPVEDNALMTEEKRAPHTPERDAPFEVYDCLKPYTGELAFKDGVAAVCFTLQIPEDAVPGILHGSIRIGDITVPVELEISSAVIPAETLKICYFYNKNKVIEHHHVEDGSAEFEKLDKDYHLLMRRLRQNIVPAPVVRTSITDLGDNQYAFDFSKMEKYMRYAQSLGFKGFYAGIGYSKNYLSSTIYVHEMESTSFEAYRFLAQFLPALSDFLEKNGWLDSYMLSICDEPKKANFVEYRALSGLVRRLAPKIKQIEPTSFGYTQGYLDTYVVLSNQYAEHIEEFEVMRSFGGEYWYYDCCGPRGNGYINRFMDCPLIAVRYHGWANYAYNFTGYLHWALNNYQPGQNPFIESCPMHINAQEVLRLPAGDTHLVYPGDNGPWISVRFENQRASTEEYEMLRALAETNKELADSLCNRVFRSFTDVEYDPLVFRATRNELIRALEK